MPIVWAINSCIRKNKIVCSVCKFSPFVPIFAGFFAGMILHPAHTFHARNHHPNPNPTFYHDLKSSPKLIPR